MSIPEDECFCPVDFGDPQPPDPREWYWMKNYHEDCSWGLVYHCFKHVAEDQYVALCGETREHGWDKLIGGPFCRKCLALAKSPEQLEDLPPGDTDWRWP
jgi:hypothetical protein